MNFLFLVIMAILIVVIIFLYVLLSRKTNLLKQSVEEHYKEYSKKSFWTVAFIAFKKYTLQILICISLLIILFYFTLKYSDSQLYIQNKELFKEIYGLGLAIFSSGILLAVLKWFQFNGFFKEELHSIMRSSDFEQNLKGSFSEVLYSDEFLKKQKDLPLLWKRVNKALFENEFPKEIADNVELKIQELFFRNKKLSHHYRNMVLSLTISLDNNFITLREISESRVSRTSVDKFKFDFTFYVIKFDPADTISLIDIHEIKIDGHTISLDRVEDEVTDKSLSKKIWIELEGSTDYQVYTDTTLKYRLDADHEYMFYAERFIDNLRLNLQNSDNLRAIFVPLGADEFDDVPFSANQMTKTYNNILLPDKGFRLIFVPNN